MAEIPGTIPIAGPFAPTDDQDTYPTNDPQWQLGGCRTVADITERDAISNQRRQEGMLAYVISDSTTYQLVGGITNGSWQEFSGGGSSGESKRYYYDTLITSEATWPIIGFSGVTKMSAREIVEHWDVYAQCKWQIENTSTGIVTDGLSFPTQQDFFDWKNANVANDGISWFEENIIAKCYDEIDESIPVITRMYGTNRLYAAMKVSSQNFLPYKHQTTHLGGGNWDQSARIRHAMFLEHYPSYSAFVVENDFANGSNGAYTTWCGRNSNRMYGVPRVGESVDLNGGVAGNRRASCENWEGLGGFPPTHEQYYLDEPRVLILNPGNSIDILNPIYPGHRRVIREKLISVTSPSSALLFYRCMSGSQAVGERYFSVYVKAVGIDELRINFFDTIDYSLEVVFLAKERTIGIEKILPAQYANFRDDKADNTFLTKQFFMPNRSRYGVAFRQGSPSAPRAYYRLRDNVTGKVGALSRACIRTETKLFTPFSFVVGS